MPLLDYAIIADYDPASWDSSAFAIFSCTSSFGPLPSKMLCQGRKHASLLPFVSLGHYTTRDVGPLTVRKVS